MEDNFIIAQQNDIFRKHIFGIFGHETLKGKFLVTEGIKSLDQETALAIRDLVISFDKFTEDNDPYGEHDFGAFDYAGQKIFWKIDYYDRAYEMHSPDKSDPKQTRRVLTVMLASEY